MAFKHILVAAAVIGIGAPSMVMAQGLVGGAENGAARGAAEAGPVGAVVGGAVGAATGTVDGALGIGPRPVAPCGTRSVTRTNGEGDSVTHSESNC